MRNAYLERDAGFLKGFEGVAGQMALEGLVLFGPREWTTHHDAAVHAIFALEDRRRVVCPLMELLVLVRAPLRGGVHFAAHYPKTPIVSV